MCICLSTIFRVVTAITLGLNFLLASILAVYPPEVITSIASICNSLSISEIALAIQSVNVTLSRSPSSLGETSDSISFIIFDIVFTESIGYFPEAVSAESIRHDAPSSTEFAMSEISAFVG